MSPGGIPTGPVARLAGVKTLLFDLDGTLLANDIEAFVPAYVAALSRVAAAHVDPGRFAHQLLAATRAMVADTDPARTNAEAFSAAFYPALGLDQAEWELRFARFYQEEFPKLAGLTSPKPAAARVLDLAVARGYELVLATNPVFPRVAILERMRWAGVLKYPWRLITDYETMHFCKPQPGYYREILDRVGRQGSQCLMTGNDVEEDLVASELGMATYLETTQLIWRRSRPLQADFVGNLDELAGLLALAPGPA